MVEDPAQAHRQVTRRDGRLEGEPDQEPSGTGLPDADQMQKDAQRDLTSLSTNVPRTAAHEDDED